MDSNTISSFQNLPFESDSNLIRSELGIAQRLKRRWTIGLGVVGALALLSLVLVALVAARKNEAASETPRAAAVTMKLTEKNSDTNWIVENWRYWLNRLDNNTTEGNNTAEGNDALELDKQGHDNFSQTDIVQFKREDLLQIQLLDLTKKMAVLEERIEFLEKQPEAPSSDGSESSGSEAEPKVDVSDKVEHQLNDLIRNWTTSQSVSLERLDAMQNKMDTISAEMEETKQSLVAIEDRWTDGSADSSIAVPATVEKTLRNLESNVSLCQSGFELLTKKYSDHSPTIDQLKTDMEKMAKSVDLDAVVTRLSSQEQKLETAYGEMSAQMVELKNNGENLDQVQNAHITDIKEDLIKVRQRLTGLDGSIKSVSDSKGKCLVGRVNPPNCPTTNSNCWPYQTSVSFRTAFDKVPTVIAAISKLDTNTDENRGLMSGRKDNVVVRANVHSVTSSSFTVKVEGGKYGSNVGNNHLFDADIVWVACV